MLVRRDRGTQVGSIQALTMSMADLSTCTGRAWRYLSMSPAAKPDIVEFQVSG